jgi:hypothetical protein
MSADSIAKGRRKVRGDWSLSKSAGRLRRGLRGVNGTTAN